jgi:nitrogen fixation protein FixH
MNKTQISDGTKVFLIVSGIFAVVISANMTMYYLAYKSFDGLVENNYYKRGLNYQSELDQETNQHKLGWHIDLKNSQDKYIVSAKDNKGNTIKNAQVKLTFFRPTQAGFDQTINLKEISPGIYDKSIKLPLPGIWDIYIEVEKEKDKWKKKQRISI